MTSANDTPLSKKLFVPLLIIALAVIAAYALVSLREEAKERPVVVNPLLVRAMDTQPETVTVEIPSQGTVLAHTETTLAAEVSGQIIAVSDNFVVGGFFRKGDLLLKIDDRNYRANVKRAEAAVAQAKSLLAQEKGRAEVAADDFRRRNKGEDLSPEARALALREPQLAEAKAALDSAIADLDHAKHDLQRTRITAPYDGLIRSKHADLGQFVTMGSPVANTFAVDYAEVRLPVSEAQLPFLDLSMELTNDSKLTDITLTQTINGKDYQYPAKLVRTEGVLDAKSRVLFVIARIKDPYNLYKQNQQADIPLRIGSFVEATIDGKALPDITVVPRSVIRAGNKVWAIENNTLQEYQVSVIPAPGTNALISDGLPANSKICLTAVGPVMPGTKVEIIE